VQISGGLGQKPQKELAEQIKQEKAKLRREERERENKKKLIVGALVLKHYQDNPQVRDWLERLLDAELSNASERILFGLGEDKRQQDQAPGTATT
jgi:hypothetical protein